MALVVAVGSHSPEWATALRRSFAVAGVDQTVALATDNHDLDEVEFVLMWNLSPDELAMVSNLLSS